MQKGGLLKHVGKLFVVGPPSLFVCLRINVFALCYFAHPKS
jgi:hypothetical protein